jgi:hypothetical protein
MGRGLEAGLLVAGLTLIGIAAFAMDGDTSSPPVALEPSATPSPVEARIHPVLVPHATAQVVRVVIRPHQDGRIPDSMIAKATRVGLRLIVPPTAVNPGPLKRHGGFRLIPNGNNQPLFYRRNGLMLNGRIKERSIEEARQSNLFIEPAYLPPGYTLAAVQAMGTDDLITSVTFEYRHEDSRRFPITMFHALQFETPVDVYLGPPDGFLSIRPTEINGVKAIFQEPKPEHPMQLPINVQLLHGNVKTVLQPDVWGPTNNVAEFQELVRMAESLDLRP